MRLSTEARVGLFFILGLGLLLVVWEMVGKEGLFARGFMLRGRFERVTGLKVGDPVKLAGVDVGTVTALEPMDDKVEVRMRIAQGTQIREDSVASIRFTSLLGGVHLDITLGTPAAPL
ncbi:MAG: MlaD family protein, partial [Candidatus Methylomirabilales bacterium]